MIRRLLNVARGCDRDAAIILIACVTFAVLTTARSGFGWILGPLGLLVGAVAVLALRNLRRPASSQAALPARVSQ